MGGALVMVPGPDRAVVFQQFALPPCKTVRERAERVARYSELMGLQEAKAFRLVINFGHYLRRLATEA